jgi:hypothetical protein
MEIVTINETWNGAKTIPIGGRYFRLLSTVNSVDVEIGIGGQLAARLIAVSAGAWVKIPENRRPFTEIKITTGANENVKAVVSDGEVGYDLAGADVTDRAGRQLGTLSGAAHTPASKVAGAASSQMLAANGSRRYLAVQVPDTAAAAIAINTGGGTAVADTTCTKINPGEMFEPAVPPTGAINMIRFGGADITFHVIEA